MEPSHGHMTDYNSKWKREPLLPTNCRITGMLTSRISVQPRQPGFGQHAGTALRGPVHLLHSTRS